MDTFGPVPDDVMCALCPPEEPGPENDWIGGPVSANFWALRERDDGLFERIALCTDHYDHGVLTENPARKAITIHVIPRTVVPYRLPDLIWR